MNEMAHLTPPFPLLGGGRERRWGREARIDLIAWLVERHQNGMGVDHQLGEEGANLIGPDASLGGVELGSLAGVPDFPLENIEAGPGAVDLAAVEASHRALGYVPGPGERTGAGKTTVEVAVVIFETNERREGRESSVESLYGNGLCGSHDSF